MRRMKGGTVRAALLTLVASFAAAACGASPGASVSASPPVSAAATPTATPVPPAPSTPVVGTGAADPLTAVKEITNSIANSGTAQFCGHAYAVAPCPVTQRFGDRLDSNPFSGPAGGAAAICRCQNAPQQVFRLVTEQPTYAYISYDIGGGAPTLRFTVLLIDGSWYADDQDLGCAATSIYNPGYNFVSRSATPEASAPASSC